MLSAERVPNSVTLTAGGEAEKLAEELQKGCPAFFREDDRIFYRASGLLQQAESGQSSPVERADLAREALRLMMQVGPLPPLQTTLISGQLMSI